MRAGSSRLSIADEKRRDFDLQELASLHPKYFDPVPDVLVSYDSDDRLFGIRVTGREA